MKTDSNRHKLNPQRAADPGSDHAQTTERINRCRKGLSKDGRYLLFFQKSNNLALYPVKNKKSKRSFDQFFNKLMTNEHLRMEWIDPDSELEN